MRQIPQINEKGNLNISNIIISTPLHKNQNQNETEFKAKNACNCDVDVLNLNLLIEELFNFLE